MSYVEYKAKQYDLKGLNGISDQTLEVHFKLYEGYVTNTNVLNRKLSELLESGPVTPDNMPLYSELSRRLGFEYNGMVLHEYYFGNLTNTPSPINEASLFYKSAVKSFGSFENWKNSFVATGKMRGVGWAVAYLDPSNGRLSNNWITLHEEGNIAGYKPVLVMDVWEHAFLLDYKPIDRPKYIESFLSNVNWSSVEERLK